ncbi:anaerobic ribonucleoside-triphosphate reductase, partial [Enterococcus faecium]|nr:anaerobic ribonucleoside-triphosphate reductase [Enterococcus faecium]
MKVNYEEKTVVTQQPETSQMKVIKRDGRHVDFDEQKINEALIKAEKKIHGSLSPLTYEKIQMIADLVVQEIKSRFAENVKIYEIQNIVEHILLEKNEYELAEEYINYRTKRDFARSKATDINFSIEKLIN